MYKAYKYRIYPNKQQKELIRKTFGCCRFVYNQTLAYKKELYEKEKKSVSKIDCNNYCNRELKKTYEWLREVDKFALTNAIYNMDSAYQKFFKEHAGYPKFKSKHDNQQDKDVRFVSLDDDFPKQKYDEAGIGDCLVRTSFYEKDGGLRKEHVEKAVEILNWEDWNGLDN